MAQGTATVDEEGRHESLPSAKADARMIYQDAVAEDGETAISVPSETVNQRSPASDDRDIIMARIRETGQRAREALAAAFDGLPETDDPEDYTRDAAEAAKDWLDDLLAAIDAFICLD